MTLFHDNRRKDFIEQVVHHIATVSLLGMILFFIKSGRLKIKVNIHGAKWTVKDKKER